MGTRTFQETTWRHFFFVFLAILAVKLIFLFLDSTPAYFLGDSASYLATATIDWIPPDRSFLYGFFVRLVALHTHSLAALVWVQALLSAVAAWLVCVGLRRLFRVRFLIAATFGLLCAFEPLQLMMERYVMTETLANFLFVIYFLMLLAYLKQGKLLILLAAQMLGILLIGVRISFLPEILINSVLAPLLSPAAMMFWRRLGSAVRGRTTFSLSDQVQHIGVHVILSIIVSQGAMAAYEDWNGRLSKREPALLYESGAFLLADFAPLIEPEDFPPIPQRNEIFRADKIDRHDILSRPAQHFVDGGLWLSIQKAISDPKRANEIAAQAAIHAVERQPIAAGRLAVRTFLLYFNTPLLHHWLLVDEDSEGVLEGAGKTWIQRFYGVPDPKAYQSSLTKGWHLAAYPWYWVILCTLLGSPLLLVICRRRERPVMIFCVATALMFLVGATLTVDRPTPRFLTTDAWLVLLFFGYAVDAIVRTRTRAVSRSVLLEPVSVNGPAAVNH